MVGFDRSAKGGHQADEIRIDTSEHINTLTSMSGTYYGTGRNKSAWYNWAQQENTSKPLHLRIL